MTQNEYRDIVAFLRRNFPNARKYRDRATMNDGWRLVKDMDAQTVMGNAVEFMQTYPYPPDIKELACQNTGEADQAKEGERYHIPASLLPHIERMAEKFKDDPCMMIHEKGGVVGETMRRYFPDPVCKGCGRSGDEMRCYGVIFGGERQCG